MKNDIETVNSTNNYEYVSYTGELPFRILHAIFSRFFSDKMEVSYKQYLTKIRLSNAKKQLIKTDDSILKIAMDNGFSDARGLINAFKKEFATTPLQYRKSMT